MKKIYLLFLPAFLFPKIEAYLQKMSSRGWMLISYSPCFLLFEKAVPKNTRYFLWHGGGYLKSDGQFDLNLRYSDIAKTFGVPRSHSKLNTFTRRTPAFLRIIEVKPQPDDPEAYGELIRDRNRLYRLETLRNCMIAITIGFCFCSKFLSDSPWVSAIGWVLIIISIIWIILTWFFLGSKAKDRSTEGN